ncbi:MAG: tetraacyldisaccharide 4'-kinase [Phycisphaerales bacterium]|jgi:tetraacyldisaccharide 4'-kinase
MPRDARAPSGPMPGVLRPLAPLAERVYARAIARRNARFDVRQRASAFSPGGLTVTIDRPVISIGNLSVGGTGKTPVVQLVCRWLRDAGRNPAIAIRGYGSRDGLSDEAELHREALPGIAMAIGPNRVHELIRLFGSEEGDDVDVVVLDDGFQHRRLARQLDVVLIDATQDVFAQRLLPAGWLREPVASLARAHAVILTHADRANASDLTRTEAELRRRFPHLVLARGSHEWTGLHVTSNDGDHAEQLHWMQGKNYALACAIGKPDAFIEQATKAFGPPAQTLALRDHDPYAPATVERLRRMADGCSALLVTQKDWTKLAHVPGDSWPCPVTRPILEMRLTAGVDLVRDAVLAASLWQDSAAEEA